MKSKGLRFAITVGALLVALAHLLAPSLKIDFVTVVLLVVAVLPWLAPLVKSVELPGGFKIELQDVKEAAEAVIQAPTATSAVRLGASADIKFEAEVIRRGEATVASLRNVAGTDPNLALVGFRIEVEKRLRDLAKSRDIDPSRGLSSVFRELRSRELLPGSVVSALDDLIALGNQAAHGRTVDPEAAAWVFDKGPEVLASLDRLLENR